jgi:hypothetical protein
MLVGSWTKPIVFEFGIVGFGWKAVFKNQFSSPNTRDAQPRTHEKHTKVAGSGILTALLVRLRICLSKEKNKYNNGVAHARHTKMSNREE